MNDQEDFSIYSEQRYYDLTQEEREAVKKKHHERAELGANVWNTWSKDFQNHIKKNPEHTYVIDFSNYVFLTDISFKGFQFPCEIKFKKTEFRGFADFIDTTFEKKTRFDNAVFKGKAWFDGATFDDEVWFNQAQFRKYARFSEVEFGGQAWFEGISFDQIAFFNKVVFKDNVLFDESTFKANAWFDDATFCGHTLFRRVTFNGDALFGSRKTKFKNPANFNKTVFGGDAIFSAVKFISGATFDDAVFSNEAKFEGVWFCGITRFFKTEINGGAWFRGAQFLIDSEGADFAASKFNNIVTFEKTKFSAVPDFNFASFIQPPHIDGMAIKDPADIAEAGLVERYRKIKEMAIQSKDFENELLYFGLEMQSKAYLPGTSASRKYFFLAYQVCSNFGRSLRRPIAALFVFLLTMSVINGSYMALANPVSKECREHKLKYVSAVVQHTFSEASPLFRLEPQRAAEIETCLFKKKALDIRNSLWRLVHFLPATLFLFLFGLAVRNKFKIR